MKLILDETEKQWDKWLDWDDAAIGMAVRACALTLAEKNTNNALFVNSAALVLANFAAKTNASESVIMLNGVTISDKPVGHYKITVERREEPWDLGEVEEVWDGEKLIKSSFRVTDGTVTTPGDRKTDESQGDKEN